MFREKILDVAKNAELDRDFQLGKVNRMKILLIAPESYYLPVGLAFISAFLKEGGHDVDACYIGEHDQYLKNGVERYDFIGTGGMSSQLRVVKSIREIASNYGCKFI